MSIRALLKETFVYILIQNIIKSKKYLHTMVMVNGRWGMADNRSEERGVFLNIICVISTARNTIRRGM
jgi:hypothetical protein